MSEDVGVSCFGQAASFKWNSRAAFLAAHEVHVGGDEVKSTFIADDYVICYVPFPADHVFPDQPIEIDSQGRAQLKDDKGQTWNVRFIKHAPLTPPAQPRKVDPYVGIRDNGVTVKVTTHEAKAVDVEALRKARDLLNEHIVRVDKRLAKALTIIQPANPNPPPDFSDTGFDPATEEMLAQGKNPCFQDPQYPCSNDANCCMVKYKPPTPDGFLIVR